eukprot:TRINITY_DN4504_c0_g2_i1.p1 TRINITY_DN4504_c0_g2~~TRINITY_DN4504_c0_g2_i1.p1  ORF type:complete len:904 (-),score=232.19 TRINITY_DN4504_c0_g2_i1:65-2776(-)
MATYSATSRALKDASQSNLSKEEKQLENIKRITFKDLEPLSVEDVLLAFLQSEEAYVDVALRSLVDFVKRLKTRDIPGVDEDVIFKMFSNIEAIYDFNQEFLKDLKDLTAEGRLLSDLGKTVVSLGPFFKLYGLYVNSQQDASELYRKTALENQKFAKLAKENFQQTGFKLSALMELPVARLPQYLIYLGTLILKLQGTEYEYSIGDIQDGIQQIKNTLDVIAQQLRDKNAREAVVKLQLDVFKNNVNLVDPSRYLIKRGQVTLINQQKSLFQSAKEKVFAALFNDMFMIVNSNGTPKKIIRSRSATVDKVADNSLQAYKNAFRISDGNTSFILECNSENAVETWVAEIQGTIDTQRGSIIGAHIGDDYFEKMIMKKAAQVPLVDAKQVQRELSIRKNLERTQELQRSQSLKGGFEAKNDEYQVSAPPPSRGARNAPAPSQDGYYNAPAQAGRSARNGPAPGRAGRNAPSPSAQSDYYSPPPQSTRGIRNAPPVQEIYYDDDAQSEYYYQPPAPAPAPARNTRNQPQDPRNGRNANKGPATGRAPANSRAPAAPPAPPAPPAPAAAPAPARRQPAVAAVTAPRGPAPGRVLAGGGAKTTKTPAPPSAMYPDDDYYQESYQPPAPAKRVQVTKKPLKAAAPPAPEEYDYPDNYSTSSKKPAGLKSSPKPPSSPAYDQSYIAAPKAAVPKPSRKPKPPVANSYGAGDYSEAYETESVMSYQSNGAGYQYVDDNLSVTGSSKGSKKPAKAVKAAKAAPMYDEYGYAYDQGYGAQSGYAEQQYENYNGYGNSYGYGYEQDQFSYDQGYEAQAYTPQAPEPEPVQEEEEPRGGLLAEIRQGIKLKKVADTEKRDYSAPAVGKESSNLAKKAAGVGLEADLAKALAGFQKAVQGVDDDDDPSKNDFDDF